MKLIFEMTFFEPKKNKKRKIRNTRPGLLVQKFITDLRYQIRWYLQDILIFVSQEFDTLSPARLCSLSARLRGSYVSPSATDTTVTK